MKIELVSGKRKRFNFDTAKSCDSVDDVIEIIQAFGLLCAVKDDAIKYGRINQIQYSVRHGELAKAIKIEWEREARK